MSKGHQKPTIKEVDRMTKAAAAAQRARMAPLVVATKQFFAHVTASAKASFGWLLRPPAKELCRQVEKHFRLHRSASDHLNKLLSHPLDVGVSVGARCVRALARFCTKTGAVPGDWTLQEGVSRRVKKEFPRFFIWVVQWTHPALQLSLNLRQEPVAQVDHRVRESWRVTMWHEFLSTSRKDAAQLVHVPYESHRFKKARLASAVGPAAHKRALLTGGFWSPVRYHVVFGDHNGLCPQSGAAGSAKHVFWECPHSPPPRMPSDRLERILGWPAQDTEVLEHMAKVRRAVLDSHCTGVAARILAKQLLWGALAVPRRLAAAQPASRVGIAQRPCPTKQIYFPERT